MAEQDASPDCGGAMSSWHEETIIMLGHPNRVRRRRRCLDTQCGGSRLKDEQQSVPEDHADA